MISSAPERKRYSCAMCGAEVLQPEGGEQGEWRRYFPFCSSRCKTADLANWARGSYAIPSRDVVLAGEDYEET